LLLFAGCDKNSSGSTSQSQETSSPVVQSSSATTAQTITRPPTNSGPTPMYTYEIVNIWHHDPTAFTQGLLYLNGVLFESTGLYGASSLREVDLQTGQVRRRVPVPSVYFAEGLVVLDNQIFQLTWTNGKAFVYDLKSFKLQKEFSYTGEGWGLTTDGKSLLMSDGSDQIFFRDPNSFKIQKTIHVSDHGRPVMRLNELEYVKGEILANIWQTDFVARIDPATGNLTGLIDLHGLLQARDFDATTDVLNGIAYDPAGDRLFVTGKHWPKLFEVRLKPK